MAIHGHCRVVGPLHMWGDARSLQHVIPTSVPHGGFPHSDLRIVKTWGGFGPSTALSIGLFYNATPPRHLPQKKSGIM